MTGIDLVRHGQASFGADDDDRLSPLGEEQARLLGDWARECGFGIGRVALGTARRHRQSAERCLATPGSGPSAGDWIVEPGFDEFDHHDVLIRFRSELAEPGALGRWLARSAPRTAPFSTCSSRLWPAGSAGSTTPIIASRGGRSSSVAGPPSTG
jgi:broad specificity phosphatase PhoE